MLRRTTTSTPKVCIVVRPDVRIVSAAYAGVGVGDGVVLDNAGYWG